MFSNLYVVLFDILNVIYKVLILSFTSVYQYTYIFGFGFLAILCVIDIFYFISIHTIRSDSVFQLPMKLLSYVGYVILYMMLLPLISYGGTVIFSRLFSSFMSGIVGAFNNISNDSNATESMVQILRDSLFPIKFVDYFGSISLGIEKQVVADNFATSVLDWFRRWLVDAYSGYIDKGLLGDDGNVTFANFLQGNSIIIGILAISFFVVGCVAILIPVGIIVGFYYLTTFNYILAVSIGIIFIPFMFFSFTSFIGNKLPLYFVRLQLKRIVVMIGTCLVILLLLFLLSEEAVPKNFNTVSDINECQTLTSSVASLSNFNSFQLIYFDESTYNKIRKSTSSGYYDNFDTFVGLGTEENINIDVSSHPPILVERTKRIGGPELEGNDNADIILPNDVSYDQAQNEYQESVSENANRYTLVSFDSIVLNFNTSDIIYLGKILVEGEKDEVFLGLSVPSNKLLALHGIPGSNTNYELRRTQNTRALDFAQLEFTNNGRGDNYDFLLDKLRLTAQGDYTLIGDFINTPTGLPAVINTITASMREGYCGEYLKALSNSYVHKIKVFSYLKDGVLFIIQILLLIIFSALLIVFVSIASAIFTGDGEFHPGSVVKSMRATAGSAVDKVFKVGAIAALASMAGGKRGSSQMSKIGKGIATASEYMRNSGRFAKGEKSADSQGTNANRNFLGNININKFKSSKDSSTFGRFS